MAYDIFISYRRDGGKEIARILKESLKTRYRVFLDYDNLTDGRFDKRIMEAIDSAPIFAVILSENCLDRCVNEDDWVRQEIEYADFKKKHIIPINPDKRFKQFPEGIPQNLIKSIGQHQFSILDTDQLYNESLEKIIRERIEPILSNKDNPGNDTLNTEKQRYFNLTISTDATCELLIDGERVRKIKKGKNKIIKVPSNGKNKFTFNCLEFKVIPIVIDNNLEEGESKQIELCFSELRKKDILKKQQKTQKNKSFMSMISYYEKVDDETFDGLTLVKNKGSYGFLDDQGIEVIPCIYENATRFSEGYASVLLNGKWHVIDKYGLETIDIYSDIPIYFVDSLSVICQNGKYGIIDIDGNILIAYTYDYLTYPSEGHLLFAKKNNKFYVININNEIINPIPYDSYDIHHESIIWGISNELITKEKLDDNNGRIIINLEGYCIDVPVFPCFVSQRGLVGLLNEEGKQIIPCFAESFEKGKRSFMIVKAHNKYGIVNNVTGRIVLPITYSMLIPFPTEYGKHLFFAALNGFYSSDYIHATTYFPDFFKLDKMFVSDSYGIIGYNPFAEKYGILIPFEYNAIHDVFGNGYRIMGLKMSDNIEYTKDVNLLAMFFMYGRKGIIDYIKRPLAYPREISELRYTIDTYISGQIQKSTTYINNTITEVIDYEKMGNEEQQCMEKHDWDHYTDKVSDMKSNPHWWFRIDRDTEMGLNNIEKTYELSGIYKNKCKREYNDFWEKVYNALDASSYVLIYKDNHYGLFNKKYNRLLLPIKYKEINISLNMYQGELEMTLFNDEEFMLPSNILLDIKAEVKIDNYTCEFGIRLNSEKETYYSFDARFTTEMNVKLLT